MNKYLVREGQKVDLDDFDPDDTSLLPGGKAEAKEQLAAITARLAEIQELRYVVPASQKWYRNHLVGSIIAETLDKLHLKYPKCDLSDVVVE